MGRTPTIPFSASVISCCSAGQLEDINFRDGAMDTNRNYSGDKSGDLIYGLALLEGNGSASIHSGEGGLGRVERRDQLIDER